MLSKGKFPGDILAITSPFFLVFLLLYDFSWVSTFPQNGLLVFP